MLTIKELQYVDLWANRTPMPGEEYSLEVLKRMEKCYKLYQETYKDQEYNILFSNSEELNLAIFEKNLCHMLGVDFNNIRGEFFENYREKVFGMREASFSSYDLLELILENKEKVAEFDNDPNNNCKAINYYKSSIKCEIFNKLSDFYKFNFILVDSTKKDPMTNPKNLVIASNEALTPYFVMSIVKSTSPEDEGKYVVSSLLAPTSPKEYFENMEAAIPTQLLISDNSKLTKLVAMPEEKIQLLTMYSNIVNKYKIPSMMNIYGDYENQLNEMSKTKVKTL